MEESKGHRKHDRQFKEEAVRLVTEGNRPVAEVARGLGIHENLLRTWKKKYKEDPSGSFPGRGRLKPQDEEFKRLQYETRAEATQSIFEYIEMFYNRCRRHSALDICHRYLLSWRLWQPNLTLCP